MCIGLHVKYPLFLSDFNKTCIISKDFSKNTQIPNFIKIRPVGAELFHAEGKTDRHYKSNGWLFPNFANSPNNNNIEIKYFPYYVLFSRLVSCLCPSSVRVVATFPGTVLFSLLCSALPFFSPNTLILFFI